MDSLCSIDVGFDPRAQRLLCRISDRHVMYEVGEGVEAHKAEVEGDIETVGETLARAGYSVIVAETANGRSVQCTPPDCAPPGQRPEHEWDGPVWAVQPPNDNYWVLGPSLLVAIDRAGWRPDQVRRCHIWEDDKT